MNAIPSIRDFSPATAGEIMETVMLKGDLAALMPDERVAYYNTVCQTIGVDPLMKPFAYITLNKQLTLYALKACTDQLRKKHSVSITIVSREIADDLLTVHVKARDAQGREDEDLGVVHLPASTKGEARANLILKAVTKAKRRVTLSICGLGMLDETEVEDIPAQAKREAQPEAPSNPDQEGKALETQDITAGVPPASAVQSRKPTRKRKDPGREADPRYEAIISADQPRRAFDRAEPGNPDAEREAWEAEERANEFLRMEHEIQCLPSLDALNRWVADNHARIAQFSDGNKNGLRMAWANKKASLEPHSLSQKAMAARGQRYFRPNDSIADTDYAQAAE